MSTIIRTNKKDNPYVMIDKYGLNDERLSWKAKGLLAYLLSKPDDWQIYESDLINRGPDGRDSVRTALRELEANGYLQRRQLRNEDGSFGKMEYIVYERPIVLSEETAPADGNSVYGDSLQTQNPRTENPTSDNPLLLNNDLTKNDITDMYVCMGVDNSDANDEPLLDSLSKGLSKINPSLMAYFPEIYAMLQKHFSNRLDPEVISIACQLFYEKSIDQYNFDPKIAVKNPTGWFYDCYKDAIYQWKAKRYKERH
jgi:hypothetical protein